ncbi:polysaccharide deacetylase family protein [Lysinibacillus piscis]|uniref:Polysaccharide deacetylase familiy protein n=1 Tax=Lysinibacillus piscis TaxID=2518931 RepID=A0ABQ5NMM7_9BACI|nr:polysaccharide deacetylase family protein [Lysinibacillus sp. KH24]GLC89589.1 polysaccharide deacetylase familiy protein [Lysinibacillus sp. KH24]
MKKGLIRATLLVAGGWLSYSVIATAIYKKTSFVQTDCEGGVALTFDDGPHPIYTPQLLDLLKEFDIKATFFVVGENAQKHPAIIKRMHEEGHTIGIHHYQHTSNWLMLPHMVKNEIEHCAQVIEKLTGERPTLYRPPWGHLNSCVPTLAKPYRIVLWTRHFSDWRTARIQHTLEDELVAAAQKGGIFLLHDNGQTVGADEDAPYYMLKHLESFLRKNAHTTKFILLQ